MGYRLLEEPYNATQIKAIQNIAGDTSGIISVPLSSIIDEDLEGFLNLLEYGLIGDNGILSDVEYKVVGVALHGYDLHVYVCGVVEFIDGDD